jgi:peroxiredoxin
MIPHERSLVSELKGKPFAIVGINTDGQEKYAEWQKKLPVVWRSFDDGNPEGPICRRWDVSGFPTVYVLDHRGVIRQIDCRDEELAKVVKELVAEAEKAPESR